MSKVKRSTTFTYASFGIERIGRYKWLAHYRIGDQRDSHVFFDLLDAFQWLTREVIHIEIVERKP